MKRQSNKLRKANRTTHRRAMENPKINADVTELRRIWDRIDPIERGERLLHLVEQECSPRGLEEELQKSATNIRRYMTLAALPEPERAAVRAGFSAKKILQKKASDDRRRKMQERVAIDTKTGEFSNRIADTIIEFCRTVDGVPESPITEPYLVSFLSEARNAMWELESRGIRAIKLPKRLSLKQRFKRTRPPNEVDDSWMSVSESGMGHRARWLAFILLGEAPERAIRESAIEKAGRRDKELRIPRIPMESWKHTLDRMAWLAQGPPRRKF